MSSPTSPTVASWELALRLQERRQQIGMDAKTVADAIGVTRNYWSAVENERKLLSVDNLDRVLDLLEFDQEAQQELRELRMVARERGWWDRYSMLAPEIQRFYGLESGALSVQTYEGILVPGLLQIADYARALIGSDATVRKVEVDQLIEVRLKRQERLSGDNALRLTALISEAVLWQEIGGRPVMRRQLQHLVDSAEQHGEILEIRVIPFSVESCGLFGAATTHIMDFSSSQLRVVAWQETVTARGVIWERALVRDILTTYNAALNVALSPQKSIDKIRRRIVDIE